MQQYIAVRGHVCRGMSMRFLRQLPLTYQRKDLMLFCFFLTARCHCMCPHTTQDMSLCYSFSTTSFFTFFFVSCPLSCPLSHAPQSVTLLFLCLLYLLTLLTVIVLPLRLTSRFLYLRQQCLLYYGLKLLVCAALRYQCMRPKATRVCGLTLLVYSASRYQCMQSQATSV